MLRSRKFTFRSVRAEALTVVTAAEITAVITEVITGFILRLTLEPIIALIIPRIIAVMRAVTHELITQLIIVRIIAAITGHILVGILSIEFTARIITEHTIEVIFAAIKEGLDKVIGNS
jgi:hypothetical protein